MAQDGHLCGGAVGQLIYWLALLEFLRGGGWRPDRTRLFGPARLRETDMPAIMLKMEPLVPPYEMRKELNR